MEKKEFLINFNLTENQFYGKEEVGGSLDLGSLTSIPDGFNPTVGGYLDLGSEQKYIGSNVPDINVGVDFISWEDDKYILVDGMFTEVVKKKGNVYHIKELTKDKVFYLVTDGSGKWSHGDTLKEAREDLIYKISDVDLSELKSIPKDKKLSFSEAISCYRKITGSCSFRIKQFVKEKNISKRKKYSIVDIIKLTKGNYGSLDFVNFFST